MHSPQVKRAVKQGIRIIKIALVALVVGVSGLHFMLTGWPFPLFIVKRLHNPIQVKQITAAGFVTSDSKLIKVQYVNELPVDSEIIRAAVAKGIEVTDKGQTFGLLKIWHWCGNDPVRYHIARVNLSALILAAGGKPDSDVTQDVRTILSSNSKELKYERFGLRMDRFFQIQTIQRYLKMDRRQESLTP